MATTLWSDTAIIAIVPDGVPSGAFSVTANAQTTTSVVFNVTPLPSKIPLPSGWLETKIAPPVVYFFYSAAPGDSPTGGSEVINFSGQTTWTSATYLDGTFTISGSGQITGTTDEGHFVYQPLAGDGAIVARLTSVAGSGGQAGVMIRETLDAGASQAMTYSQTPYLYLFDRPSTGSGGSNSNYAYDPSGPYWMKLVRSGSALSSYTSTDGVNWAQVGASETISMANNVFIGMFVTSGGSSSMATATFDNVSVGSIVSPAPTITSLSTTTGPTGSQVTILGSGFGASQGSSVALLDGVALQVVSWTSNLINVTIPSGATSGPMVVSVAPSMNDSNPVIFQVTTQPLPTSWLDQDIGSVPVAGSATYTNGTFTVNGTGVGISGMADGMHFVYQLLPGDGAIVARVVSVQNGAQAGIAIRETLNANSTEGVVLDQADYLYYYNRASTGASVTNAGDAYDSTLPTWLKLSRSGNTVSSYSSVDGVNWVQVGTDQTITMAQNVYVGLIVSTAGGSTLGTATFDNVSISASSSSSGPLISSLSSPSGAVGSSITITGTNFGTSPAASAVTFNGVAATVTSSTFTAITTTVPSGATTGNVVVTVAGLISNGVSFAVNSGPALVSIVVSPATSALLLGANERLNATGIFSDSSAADVTMLVSWSSSNSFVATVSNLAHVQGAALGTGVGTANIIATFEGITASGVLSVTAPPSAPSISSVSTTTGVANTPVIIRGSNFGSVRGSGCVYLGTALAIINNWTDGEIDANVAQGSTSGVVEVLQGGQQSNAITFTIASPTIASVSPTTALPGAPVHVSGSGFGSQGSGQLRLGNLNGVVTSWNDTDIFANVAAGAISGSAQVLQNGILSNTVPFGVGNPHISGINPTFGPAQTTVMISGSGFGSQSTGEVWLGSTDGVVVSWNDTLVTAKVAPGAVSGIARIQQNGVWSNSVAFTVPSLDGSAALTITPNVLTMLVGDTHTISAVNPQGQSVTGLTWASSNPSVASLSSDDPPIVTALGVGHATITAGNASADLTVLSGSSLAPGTILWSNPGDGSGVLSAVPAVPSFTGVADVFAFQVSGNVTALTADGIVAWTANIGAGKAVPDFQGGLVVSSSSGSGQITIQKLDGITGQAYPAYSSASGSSIVLVHTDGTIFTATGGSIVGIDPLTGSAKFSIPLPQSEGSNDGNCGDFAPYDNFSLTNPQQGIIAGDGYAYFSFEYGIQTVQKICSPPTESGLAHNETHARLLRVGSDGSSSVITVGDSTQDTSWSCEGNPDGFGGECGLTYSSSTASSSSGVSPGGIMTNADQGVVMSSYDCNASSCAGHLSAFDSGGMTSTVSTQVPLSPVLQRPDGSFVGYAGNNMAAFDLSGNVEWSVPNYSPVMATADGGVIGQSSDGLTASTFDANGNATGQLSNLPTYSWFGNAYQLGSVDQVSALPIYLAATYAAVLGGNLSGTGTSTESVNQTVRSLIAQIAQSDVGSQNWLDQLGSNKCNIFVHDVIKQAGSTPPQSDKTGMAHRIAFYLGLVDSPNYPAQAADWANPKMTLGLWQTLVVPPGAPAGTLPPDLSQAGDVIAEAVPYSDATGHVGIISNPGHTISADSAVNCYAPPTPSGTITDTDYGFRPSTYVDPTGCRKHGLKQNAVVKRFMAN